MPGHHLLGHGEQVTQLADDVHALWEMQVDFVPVAALSVLVRTAKGVIAAERLDGAARGAETQIGPQADAHPEHGLLRICVC